MTGEQFTAARNALGLSQSDMAKALRMDGPHSYKTLGAWENGRRDIPGPVTLAVMHLTRWL